MRRWTIGLAALTAACATAPAPELAQEPALAVAQGVVSSCSRVEADGSRTLCHEIVVPAPREEVWTLLSTSQGLSSWMAPVVALDLRIGGIWEASYNVDAEIGDPANIRNRLLSYAPGRMLSMQVAQSPPGFPFADIVAGTWSVIELDDAGAGATRVRVSGFGYQHSETFERMHAYFDRGNAWTLEQLQARVTRGPTDWAAQAPAPGSAP